jgi:hypothetical protein
MSRHVVLEVLGVKLGERLIRAGLITREQLAEAMRERALHGARLGTHLVQMGALSLDALAAQLGEQLGLQVATSALLEAAPAALRARLPRELAERHLALPIFQADGGAVGVAMVEPRELEAVLAIEQALGAPILLWVVPELRMRYWLEQHYGVVRDNFFLRGDLPRAGQEVNERRRYPTINPQLAPDPQQARLGRIVPVRRVNAALALSALPQPAAPAAEDDLGLDIVVDARRRSVPAQVAITVIDNAVSGEIIGQAVVNYFVEVGEGGLLLRIHDHLALGWLAAPPTSAEVVPMITIPLELPTAIRTAVEHGKTFRGMPSAESRPWHDRLGELLSLGPPREVLVVPVGDEHGVRALIYTQTADRPLGDGLVADLEAIGAAIIRVMDRRARGV